MGYRRAQVGGGTVEFHVSGPADAPGLLVMHVGSPCAAVGFPALTAAAARRGLRTVTYSRPGLGRSSREAGRQVVAEVERTAALADLLGHREFYVAGFSGGGPPALACAALLSDRVRACITLGSLAPPAEAGPNWLGWFSSEDAAEFVTLASADREQLVPSYEAGAAEFEAATPAHLIRRWDPLPAVDARWIRGINGPSLVSSMRRSVAHGMWGWFDDFVAYAGDWGFSVASIEVPVVVVHGGLDRHVDIRHGRWLAHAIPGAIADLPPDEGHLSIIEPEAIVSRLTAAARRQRKVS